MTYVPHGYVSKSVLRQEMIRARKSVDPVLQTQAQERICKYLKAIVEEHLPKTVAFYYPVNGEIDLLPIAKELAEIGVNIALPRVAKKDTPLVFNLWDFNEDEMDADTQGIPCSAGKLITPDMVVTPLVAFDAKGYRIGYGTGYFDRTFESLPAVWRVGVGYHFQMVKEFEVEAHDIPMHTVVTENGVLRAAEKGVLA